MNFGKKGSIFSLSLSPNLTPNYGHGWWVQVYSYHTMYVYSDVMYWGSVVCIVGKERRRGKEKKKRKEGGGGRERER